MSLSNNKLKYLIDNGYKEITPTLVGFSHSSIEQFNFFNYTIKQAIDSYKLIIDCEIFYNDVIKNLSNYYDKLPEDYNTSSDNIVIYFFIPLLKENKNNFTIYLKNVEIIKNKSFNKCGLFINTYNTNVFFNQDDNPETSSKFINYRVDTIEKIINFNSCIPRNQYKLSILQNSKYGEDILHCDFLDDYTDAEITEQKIINSKFNDNNITLFYYLLNYYYLHEKKKSISQKEFLDMYTKNTLIFKK